MVFPSTALGDLRIRADWRSVEYLYKQFTAIVSKEEQVSTEIVGSLANNMGRVLASYEDQEILFIQDLLELWSGTDGLQGSAPDRFRILYFDKRLDGYPEYKFPPAPGIRRRPRPFETAVETCRRLIDINKIRRALADVPTGAVLGGSVSYGRFYNVMGGATEFGSKASDVDLLIVLQDYNQLKDIADRLSSVSSFDKAGLDLLRRRVDKFSTIRAKQVPSIFSHKLLSWTTEADPVLFGSGIPGAYSISFHIFSLADFDYLTLKNMAILECPEGSETLDLRLHDYRDTEPPEDKAYDSRSFAGIPLGTHPLRATEVDLGFVANVQVCLIRNGRYCPGLHQNLILPQFEMRWETEPVRLYLRMLVFRWKIAERLRTERTMRPFEEQSLSLSHVRYFVFSPHITRRADSATILANQQGRA